VKQLNHFAYYDQLTDLPNYLSFQRDLDDSFSKYKQTPKCFVLVDVDNFKQFNENVGYEFGDECLKFLAKFLKEEIGGKGFVYRFKIGDEFIISIYEEMEFSKRMMEDLKVLLKNKTDVLGKFQGMSFSYGLAEIKANELNASLLEAEEMLKINKREQKKIN
jgi:diguanylate cyclase (GGDEF)-like protein